MIRNHLIICFILLSLVSFAQENPTRLGNNAQNGTNAQNYWSKAGNSNSGTPIQARGNNYFGTRWNSPIYTITDNRLRMKLNGTVSYPIDNYPSINADGYLGLGQSISSLHPNGLWVDKGPFSLLHLNGTQNSSGVGFTQEYGFRPWMQTGITFTGNNDLMYFGIRRLAPGQDQTEFTLTWSDNPGTSFGPDDMVFRFTDNGNGNTTTSDDYLTDNDMDGLHIARYTGDGYFGLGNTFGNTSSHSGYIRPQSLSHMSYTHRIGQQYEAFGFSQTTYRDDNNVIVRGDGESEFDGLRFGIDNEVHNAGGINHLNSYLRWQENTPFIVQTDWDNTPGGIESGERMRISSASAPGVPSPPSGFLPTDNITRVSIAYRGTFPLSEPRALVHLGGNLTAGSNGYANWMDYGTLVSKSDATIYTGLTSPNYPNDPNEAVIGFGESDLLFVNAEHGEFGRFESTTDQNGLPGGTEGKFGIGNFSGGTVSHKLHVKGNGRFEWVPDNNDAEYLILGNVMDGPDDVELHKLAFTTDQDVLHGDGVFRPVQGSTDDQLIQSFQLINSTTLEVCIEDGNCMTVDLANLQDGIGTDDQNLTSAMLDPGTNVLTVCIENGNCVDVDLSNLAGGGVSNSVTADNGLTMTPTSTNVQLGGSLLHSTEVDMNGYNMNFANSGNFNIGTNASLGAKLNIRSDGTNSAVVVRNPSSLETLHLHGDGRMKFKSNHAGGNAYEFLTEAPFSSFASANFTQFKVSGSGGPNLHLYGTRSQVFATNPTGIEGTISAFTAEILNDNSGALNIGYLVNSNGNVSSTKRGFSAYLAGSNGNTGAFISIGTNTNTTNYGVRSKITNSAAGSTNYAIYGNASPVSGSWAGYFQGNLHITGQVSSSNGTVIASDRKFKKEIKEITNATEILNELSPKSYYFDTEKYKGLNFSKKKEFGLIAQELQEVLPELVEEMHLPEQVDMDGKVIAEEVDFLGVKYTGLLPILIQGHKEQQEVIEQKEAQIESLEQRLTKLENIINNNNNNTGLNGQSGSNNVNASSVELSNSSGIVLNQNVPNPFAESTVITFNIPKNIQKAQIHFFDQNGVLINTSDILERGEGQLNVFANDLTTGVYTYALVIDGEVIASKKMIKGR